MKKGSEIGINPISLKNKIKTKEIEKILVNLNEVFYFFSTLLISKSLKEYILNELKQYGTELKELDVNGKANDTKEELLGVLREKYISIKNYTYLISQAEELDLDRKVNSCLVARFLKDKNNNYLTTENKLKWIKNIKLFSQFYCISKSLEGVQNELIKDFVVYKSF